MLAARIALSLRPGAKSRSACTTSDKEGLDESVLQAARGFGHLRVPGGCSGRAAMRADLSIRIFWVKPQVSLVNRSISRDLCPGIRLCSVLAILATPRSEPPWCT